jgi:hypothetical protein
VLTCKQANELYKTIRVMGGIPGEYRKLRIHAQDCEQDDWRHALPTEHWYGVRVTRERRKNYASWQERQREAMAAADERGFLSLSGLDS